MAWGSLSAVSDDLMPHYHTEDEDDDDDDDDDDEEEKEKEEEELVPHSPPHSR